MGGCFSTGTRGGKKSTLCLPFRPRRNRTTKGLFPECVINFQQLPSVHNRISTNGKSRSSCIFTQQGQKGINQDAMVVWEVSSTHLVVRHVYTDVKFWLNKYISVICRTSFQKMRYFAASLMVMVHKGILLPVE